MVPMHNVLCGILVMITLLKLRQFSEDSDCCCCCSSCTSWWPLLHEWRRGIVQCCLWNTCDRDQDSIIQNPAIMTFTKVADITFSNTKTLRLKFKNQWFEKGRSRHYFPKQNSWSCMVTSLVTNRSTDSTEWLSIERRVYISECTCRNRN